MCHAQIYNLVGKNFALLCITRLTYYLLTISIIIMVFVLRIHTKEGLRPKFEGESTPGGVAIISEIQYH